jgi:hypothetical protein
MSLIRLLPDRWFIPDSVYSWLGYRFVTFRAELTAKEDSVDTVALICNVVFKGRWGLTDRDSRVHVWGAGWCRDPWLLERRVRNALETATGGEVVTSIG